MRSLFITITLLCVGFWFSKTLIEFGPPRDGFFGEHPYALDPQMFPLPFNQTIEGYVQDNKVLHSYRNWDGTYLIGRSIEGREESWTKWTQDMYRYYFAHKEQ